MKKELCVLEKENSLSQLPQRLLAWYDKGARVLPWRENPRPYFVWISEIMLQQTRVEAVKPYFDRFVAALPDIPSLAGAEEEQLLKLWEGLGYYSRARNLKKAALQVMELYGGYLPDTAEELAALAGIGPYTAGAIASIAYGRKVPAVDGNVMRVVMRFLACAEDITQAEVRKKVEGLLKEVMPERAGDFNQSLMELGAMVCLPNGAPACPVCPLSDCCRAHIAGTELAYPVKAAKKPRRIENRTVFLLLRDGRAAICKRPDKGLLAGLWEFPSCETGEEGAALARWGVTSLSQRELGRAKHIFTHVEWQMQGIAVWTEDEGAFTWKAPGEIRKSFALPSALRFYQKELEALLSKGEL